MSPVPDFDFDALSLDVGGVLVVPDHGILAVVLDRLEVPYDRSAFGPAHYHAMNEVDRCRSDAEDFADYLRGFLHAAGVPEGRVAEARAAIDPVFETAVWCQPVPGSRAALHELAARGVRLAVTSNSDGGVAELLARHEVLQLGVGHGVRVDWISDSGTLGVAKPDPAIFLATADGLGVAPHRVLHVGDAVHYDVQGALDAGLQALHFDPFGLCADAGHGHVASLAALVPPGT